MSVERFLEFHDSELLSFDVRGDHAELLLDACIRSVECSAAKHVEQGWLQKVVVKLDEHVEMVCRPSANSMTISSGTVSINDEAIDDMVALPLDRSGRIVVSVVGTEGSLRVMGERSRFRLLASPVVESV